ncbi:hypothetical protein [Micromonospora sp. WMMD1082]|uniref:hypothetical protein n=1 Tax=Micromonospora sp. WMMD1082 TaxID=3016104 RepID=UPI002415EB66|nr:hypothetical protein [Micromonospora sp. WMMD1082]MDG4796219.1 hypothetical protein [Micromonospora sp. WMMD1082]
MSIRSTRDILINLLGRETISREADKASRGLGKLDDKMRATAADGHRLDAEIGKAEKSLKDLAVQYARTGDAAERVDLSKSMRKQQAEIRRLTRSRDLLPPFDVMGRESADKFGVGFAGRLGPVLAKVPLGPAGAAIGAGLGLAILPPLFAALGGATLATGAAAAVAGGVVLAARDSRIQAAGKDLGRAVLGDLENTVGARFVEPTLDGIRIIRQGWQDIRGDVDGIARASAKFVAPISRGLVGLLREFAPGLRRGLEKAGPVVRELERGLTRVGRSLGDLFDTLGDNANEGAAGLRWLFIVLDEGVGVIGGAIDKLGDFMRLLLAVSNTTTSIASAWSWVPIVGDQIDRGTANIDEMRAALEEGGDAGSAAGDKVAGGFRRAGDAAADSGREIQTWTEFLRESLSAAMESEHAQLRFEESIDRAAEAARDGAKKGIDPNTEAGRQNRRALLDLAAAANAAAEDIKNTTGSQELATEATERGRRNFLRAADAMGASATEAQNLANKLFGIPKDVRTKTHFDADAALARLRTYNQWLANIPRSVRTRLITEQHTVRGGVREFSRGGYVDGPGPKGVDSEWAKVAPGEGILTAREVDRLGGRAGFDRLRQVIRNGGRPAAQSSAGLAPTGGGRGGGGGITVQNLTIQAWSDRFSLRQVQDELAMHGAV